MGASNKDGIVAVFTVIAFGLVGCMIAFGLYDAARIGLLTPDWFTQLLSDYETVIWK